MPLISQELRNQNQGKFLNAYDFQDNPTTLQIINIESKMRIKQGQTIDANFYTFIDPKSGQEKIIHNDSQELFKQFDAIKVEANDLVTITTVTKQGNNGNEYLSWKVEKAGAGILQVTPPKEQKEVENDIDITDIPF